MQTSLEQEVKCLCDDGYPRSSCCKAFSRRRNGAVFSVPRAAKSASPWPRLPPGGLSRGRGAAAQDFLPDHGPSHLSSFPYLPVLEQCSSRRAVSLLGGLLAEKGRSSRPQERPCERAGPFKVSGKSRLIAKLTLSSCRHSLRSAATAACLFKQKRVREEE